MPSHFKVTSEDPSMTAREATAGFQNADQLATQLTALGYRAGAYREFQLPDPGVADYLTKMLGFQSTVMRFGSADQAHQAIPFQMDVAKGQPDWKLNEKTVDQIGDETTALTGTAVYDGTDVKVVALFVRDGADVYRFIAISGAYDAFNDTVHIAQQTVAAH